jgi:Neuroendocrine-specific golgi protein P55 (NESP55)
MASSRTPIGRFRSGGSLAGALAVALMLMLALAACGGDDEPAGATAERAETEARTETEERSETDSATEAETESETETETEVPTSPEELEGGGGDEEPARTLALFTGRDGRITPRVVRVPAFISVRVELRSADGREYGLEFENETTRVKVRVSGGLSSVSSTIDGMRPGEAIVGKPDDVGTRVRIEATAEPGP